MLCVSYFYAPLGLLSVWRRLLEAVASAVPKPSALIDFEINIVKSITYCIFSLSSGGVLHNFRFDHLVKNFISFLAVDAIFSIYLIV